MTRRGGAADLDAGCVEGPVAGASTPAVASTPACASTVAAAVPLAVAVALAAGFALPAAAQTVLLGGDDASLELGGYAMALAAVHDAGYPVQERRSAFGGSLVRLRWAARGDGWTLELHDRVQARWSETGAGRSPLGLGVSAVPARAVDLESVWVDGEHWRLAHDVDRLALTVYTHAADVTVGRQAITWGLASLFPVADLWSRFSPFELDTEEKPGLDAVRVLTYPGEGLELDVVVADRGVARDWSAGARLTASLADADVYVAGGKLWRELMVMGGVTFLLEEVRLRAEAVIPRDLDADDTGRPRATVGADWLTGDWTFAGEVHYNGIGATDVDGYRRVLGDARLLRGETYYLGRWYAGALASWLATDRATLSSTLLVNLGDGSASFTPAASWDLGQRWRLGAGALLSAGERPGVAGDAGLDLESEFGTYGHLLFVRGSVYF